MKDNAVKLTQRVSWFVASLEIRLFNLYSQINETGASWFLVVSLLISNFQALSIFFNSKVRLKDHSILAKRHFHKIDRDDRRTIRLEPSGSLWLLRELSFGHRCLHHNSFGTSPSLHCFIPETREEERTRYSL